MILRVMELTGRFSRRGKPMNVDEGILRKFHADREQSSGAQYHMRWEGNIVKSIPQNGKENIEMTKPGKCLDLWQERLKHFWMLLLHNISVY